MKKVLLGLLFLFTGTANATLLTFDDVPGGSTQNAVGSLAVPYKGFTFSSNLDELDVVGSPNWDFGAVSGDFALLNNFSGVGIITEENAADFTFDGLWAKKWSTPTDSAGSDSLFGTLSGYNNGALIWEVNTSLNGSYEFYAAQSGLIDELHLGFGSHFLVDDILLNDTSVSAVPVPAAAWLFGSALLGFFGFSRKKASA